MIGEWAEMTQSQLDDSQPGSDSLRRVESLKDQPVSGGQLLAWRLPPHPGHFLGSRQHAFSTAPELPTEDAFCPNFAIPDYS
jgi:hypothetical protein